MTLGVGLLGCGPVTQAIHVPTLATLPDRLRIAHVMDVDAEVAAAVGERVGAPATNDAARLLADPAVDVVAICSPHEFHVVPERRLEMGNAEATAVVLWRYVDTMLVLVGLEQAIRGERRGTTE